MLQNGPGKRGKQRPRASNLSIRFWFNSMLCVLPVLGTSSFEFSSAR